METEFRNRVLNRLDTLNDSITGLREELNTKVNSLKEDLVSKTDFNLLKIDVETLKSFRQQIVGISVAVYAVMMVFGWIIEKIWK